MAPAHWWDRCLVINRLFAQLPSILRLGELHGQQTGQLSAQPANLRQFAPRAVRAVQSWRIMDEAYFRYEDQKARVYLRWEEFNLPEV